MMAKALIDFDRDTNTQT